jgi:hypothetical protein
MAEVKLNNSFNIEGKLEKILSDNGYKESKEGIHASAN